MLAESTLTEALIDFINGGEITFEGGTDALIQIFSAEDAGRWPAGDILIELTRNAKYRSSTMKKVSGLVGKSTSTLYDIRTTSLVFSGEYRDEIMGMSNISWSHCRLVAKSTALKNDDERMDFLRMISDDSKSVDAARRLLGDIGDGEQGINYVGKCNGTYDAASGTIKVIPGDDEYLELEDHELYEVKVYRKISAHTHNQKEVRF